MDEAFVRMLDELRENFGHPLTLSSAKRCADYNEAVSSTGRDRPHTTGKAADILIPGPDAYAVLHYTFLMGFSGIGVKQHGPWDERFIHVDMLTPSEGPRPRVWSYK
jgi:uncharacterized protein YcbK (DUF882 family)